MKTTYVNLKQLKNDGTQFMRPSDKGVFDESLKQIDKISIDALRFVEINPYEQQEIANEFWNDLQSKEVNFFQKYSSRKKKRHLFQIMNTKCESNGKILILDPCIKTIIKLFEEDNTERVLRAWVQSMMSAWESLMIEKSNFEQLTVMLRSKFNSIEIKNEKIKNLKESKNFFLKERGTQNIAQEIIQNGKTYEVLCERMGLSKGSNSYQSIVTEDLFIYYLKVENYDKVLSILDQVQHYQTRSRKKIISSFILHVDLKNLNEYKDIIKRIAFDCISDPAEIINWTVWEGANNTDKVNLEKARNILNKWILGSFIEIFFTKLMQDSTRGEYWLGKLDMIQSVKVYGSHESQRLLLKDDRISPYIQNEKGMPTGRFQLTSSSKSNAGILMEISKFQILEFTDSGAIYNYRKDNNRIPSAPNSLGELKHPEMNMACSPSRYEHTNMGYINRVAHYLNSEGKIVHNGNWTGRMDLWIKVFAS